MISVAGLPPDVAAERLTREGCRVQLCEARSRKGVEGDDVRVIRQTQLDENEVLLTYATFITKPQA